MAAARAGAVPARVPRTVPRTVLTTVLATVALALVSGCGGSGGSAAPKPSPAARSASSSVPQAPSGSPSAHPPGYGTTYCTLLQTDLTTLFNDIRSAKDATRAVRLIKAVARSAPAEVRPEWTVIGGTLDQLRATLTKAAALQQAQKAGTLSRQQLGRQTRRLLRRTHRLRTPRTQAAGKAVVKHAASYCGVPLGG